MKADAVDAVAADRRVDAEVVAKAVAPKTAHRHPCIRVPDGAGLQAGDAGIREGVEVMDRPHMTGDEPSGLQRRQRIAGDAVMRMVDVEAAIAAFGEMLDIVGDALLDHRMHVGRRRRDREWPRLAAGGAKKAMALGVRGVQDDVMSEARQRFGKRKRVHNAAARIGGVSEHRDAKRTRHATLSATAAGARPKSFSRRQSRRSARRPPDTSVTSEPSRIFADDRRMEVARAKEREKLLRLVRVQSPAESRSLESCSASVAEQRREGTRWRRRQCRFRRRSIPPASSRFPVCRPG